MINLLFIITGENKGLSVILYGVIFHFEVDFLIILPTKNMWFYKYTVKCVTMVLRVSCNYANRYTIINIIINTIITKYTVLLIIIYWVADSHRLTTWNWLLIDKLSFCVSPLLILLFLNVVILLQSSMLSGCGFEITISFQTNYPCTCFAICTNTDLWATLARLQMHIASSKNI